MAATQLRRPRRDPYGEATKRFTGGPAAWTSAGCGAAALLFALHPRGEVIAGGLGLAAIGFAVGVLRRARRDRTPGAELAVTGIALAFLATVGMFAAHAAFSTILDRKPTAAAPAVTVAAPGAGASPSTKDVLDQMLKVDIQDWSLSLDEYGISEASLAVTVTNKSKNTKSFDLKFEALTDKGKSLTTDAAFIPNLKPGQSANVSVFNITSTVLAPELKQADVRITEAVAY
jgi:hypothetical protein